MNLHARTRVATCLVLAGVVFATSVIGAVEVWAQAVLGVLTLVAFLVCFLGREGPAASGRPRTARPEWFLVGLLALGVFQLVPLPPWLVRTLSPEAYRFQQEALLPGESLGWRPLSLYPFATHVELFRYATLAMVFVVFARCLRSKDEAVVALSGIVAIGGVTALISVIDQISAVGLLDYYPREVRHTARLAGPLVNPNHFAGLLEISALAGIGLYFSLADEPGRRPAQGLRKVLVRAVQAGTNRPAAIAVLLALLVMTCALFLSASRLGVFAFLVGLAFAGVFLTRAARPGRALGALSAVTLLVLGANAMVAVDPVLERFTLFFGDGTAGGARIPAAKAVFAMGTYFPLFGSGLGTFEQVFPAFQPSGLGGTWDRAHNDLLQTFTDGGFVGAVLAVGFLSTWFAGVVGALRRGSLRRRGVLVGSAAAAVALLVHGVGDFNFQIPGNAYLLAALMGIGLGTARLARTDARSTVRRDVAAGSV